MVTGDLQLGDKKVTAWITWCFFVSHDFLRNIGKRECAMTLHLLVAAHGLRSLISLWRSLDWGEDGWLVGWRSIAPTPGWPPEDDLLSVCEQIRAVWCSKGARLRESLWRRLDIWNIEGLLPCTLTVSQKASRNCVLLMNPKKIPKKDAFCLPFCLSIIPAFCCKYSFVRDKRWGLLYMNWHFILHVCFLKVLDGGFLTALICLAQGTTKGVSSHHCDGLQRRKPAPFNFDSYPPWDQHSAWKLDGWNTIVSFPIGST